MSLRRSYEIKRGELQKQLDSVEFEIDIRIKNLALLGEKKEKLMNQQIELKKQFEENWWKRFSDYLRTGR